MDELIRRVFTTLCAVPGFVPAAQPPAAPSAPVQPVAQPVTQAIARYIDHTLLKADATPSQVEQLCAEARYYNFASVCVNPGYVPLCRQQLAGSAVAVCTVVGFPLGATTTATKVFEARQAIADGAHEIDMVIAIGRLKAGEYAYLLDEIAQVVTVCQAGGALSKIIIETALLSDAEKIAACMLAVRTAADFVKTSTGFSSGGATVPDVALMRRVVGSSVGVKAAGGVRTLAEVQAMIAAGATRIGTSAGVQLMREIGGVTGDQPTTTEAY